MSEAHQIGLSEIQYLASLYWGFTVATVLCGMSIVQANSYFSDNADSTRMRTLMASLLTFDIVGTALVASTTFTFLVVKFDKPPASGVIVIPVSCCVEYVFAKAIVFASQIYYARRVYIVAKQRWIYPFIVVFTSFGAFGVGIAQFILLLNLRTNFLALWDHRFRILCGLNIFLAAFSDIVATVSMIHFLASQEPEYERTRRVLSKLLFYAKKRGLLVTLIQISTGIAFFVGMNKAYWIPFHLAVSKLHVTTLFSMLNCRATLRRRLDEVTSISTMHARWNTQNLEAVVKPSDGPELPPVDVAEDRCPKTRELMTGFAFSSPRARQTQSSLCTSTDEDAHERNSDGQRWL